MRIIGTIVCIILLIGVIKGFGNVDLSDGKSIGDAIVAIIDGVADVTVRLIPTIKDAFTSLVDQLPDNGDYSPPAVGEAEPNPGTP